MNQLMFGLFAAASILAGSFVHGQGQAVSLSGQGRVDVANGPIVATLPERTIEFWVKPGVVDRTIYNESHDWGPVFNVAFDSSGYIYLGYQAVPGGTWYFVFSPTGFFHVGTWTHVAGSFSTSAGNRWIINGLDVLYWPQPGGAGAFQGAVARSVIGANYSTSNPTQNPFQGEIDELRLWSTARTTQQIRATMYQEVSAAPGLLSAWHFNGTLIDAAGSNHGTLIGTGSFVQTATPAVCGGPCSLALLTANLPAPIGGTCTVSLTSPTPNAFAFVYVDIATGTTALGTVAQSSLAFTASVFPLADHFGTFGPALGSSVTDPFGRWSLGIPVPAWPALANLVLYSQAAVLDPLATNGVFHLSDLLTINFQ